MVRISKDPDVRRAEILDTAEKLFIGKGYHETSVSDITQAIGVAKSTFFYYFKTKEEILEAIVQRLTDGIIQAIRWITENRALSAIEKLERMLIAEFQIARDKRELVCNLHEIPNADMHQRLIVTMVQNYTPYLARVLEEGNREGVFNADPPVETAELLHVGIRYLFDPGLFPRNIDEVQEKITKTMRAIQRLLGAPDGSMERLTHILLDWYSKKNGEKPICL